MPNKPAHILDPFRNKKTGAWTKYGGERYGLLHSQKNETWNCQSCGKEEPQGLPGFMLAVFPSEYVKICSSCFHLARIHGYSYRRVVSIVRVANQ